MFFVHKAQTMSSVREPREPVLLKIQISDVWRVKMMSKELSDHIVPEHVRAVLPTCTERQRPLCAYFYFYYNHYKGCNVQTTLCLQCSKIISWIADHTQSCRDITLRGCIDICTKMKEWNFRKNSRINSTEEHDDSKDKDSDTSSGRSSGSPAPTPLHHRQPCYIESVESENLPNQDLDTAQEPRGGELFPKCFTNRTSLRGISNQDNIGPCRDETLERFVQELPRQDALCSPMLSPQDSPPTCGHLATSLTLEGDRGGLEIEEQDEKTEMEVATREVNHRMYTRQCLLKQLRRNGDYREKEHWVRVREIGKGGFGACYCILDKMSNYLLAMKEGTMKYRVEDTHLDTNQYIDETYICLKLARLITSKPLHVVEFFGANIVPGPYCTTVQLFEELMSSSLYDMLIQNGPLGADDVIHYSYQMFDALDFLHTKLMIVHCDIKPANLLLDITNQRLKVADFGSAVLMRECNYGPVFSGSPDAGTLHFNPPEFYRDQTCSKAFDIWQAGCCVLNMCTGRRPWRHLYMDSKIHRVKMHQRYLISQQSTHVIPSFLPEGLQRLLSDCLHPDYKCRPCAQQCQNMLVTLEGDPVKRSIDRVMTDEAAYHTASIYNSQSVFSPNKVDIYIGMEISYCGLALRPGWLGSVECPSETLSTSGQLWQYLEASLPVFKQLPANCTIATCDHTPSAIWQGLKRSDCVPFEVWSPASCRNPIVIASWKT